MRHRDMEDEMRHHLEARAAALVRDGLRPEEAARQARIEFGSTARYIEEGREAWGLRAIDRLRIDLRAAWRSMAKSPLFAAIAVATLAVGIGANTLVFSIVHGVLLKALPYDGAERLYSVRTVVPQLARLYTDMPVNGRHFVEWRSVCRSCEGLALIASGSVTVTGAGEPRRVDALLVTEGLFPMLGARMQAGRGFTQAETLPGSNPVAVLTDAAWRTMFGADPSAIGRTIVLNQKPREIVGVLPPDFRMPRGEQMGEVNSLPDRPEIYTPLTADFSKTRAAGNFNYAALLKLRPGATAAQAEAELNAPLAYFAKETKREMFARLLPLRERMTAEVRRPLWLLTGAAGALLLIVCVNLGNLLMARSAGRQRETAIRAAVGASRGDLFRHALAESLALAALGGAGGVAVAWAGLRALPSFAPDALPRVEEIAIDWTVLAVSFALSAAAGVLCSLAPSWRMWRSDPNQTLGASSQRTSESRGERRARHALVSFEAGLSMALAAAAGLLIVSFSKLMAVEKGFDVERVLTFQVALPEGRYKMDERLRFHEQLLDRLREIPGAAAVALTSHLPLQGETWIQRVQRKGGAPSSDDGPQGNYRFISPGYFRAAGTPIRAGREFDTADRERKVAVISELTARRIFPGENPIGQMLHYNDESPANLLEIIGVAADVKTAGLEAEPPLTVYLPYWRLGAPGASYVMRASVDEASLAGAVRAAVASLDREMPVHRMRTMAEIVDRAAAAKRLQTQMAGGFAAAGVLLACLGVFGVVSYGVSRRVNEIGVRMALGASRGDVIGMVMAESLRPVAIGLAGGLAAALALGQTLASQLHGVSPRDPVVLAVVAATIAAAAVVAAWLPARRAASIDPMRALRAE